MSNIFSRQGIDISDVDVREQFGISPDVGDIDKAVFSKVEDENVRHGLRQGQSEHQARAAARKKRKDAEKKAHMGQSKYEAIQRKRAGE